MPKLWLAIGGLVCLAVVSSSCGANTNPGAIQQVRGHVIEVVGRNITDVETVRILDSDGKTWTFTTRGFVGFSPSHLVQHQLFGDTIEVRYTMENEVLIALEIVD